MSNFVTVDGGKTIINLEQVAFIEDISTSEKQRNIKRIKVVFSAIARSHFVDNDAEPLWVFLSGDEAERFLAAVMRQTAIW